MRGNETLLVLLSLSMWLIPACQQQAVPSGPPPRAPAAVLQGEALAWRELCRVPSSPAGVQPGSPAWIPEPEIVLGNFDRGKGQDILYIDFKGETRIYQPAGDYKVVPKAQWEGITRYFAWDIDQDGIDDLVPAGTVYVYAPVFGKITIKGARGGHRSSEHFLYYDSGEKKALQTTRGQYTPLFRLNGKLIKQMPPIDELAPLIFGDVQGDGRAEMFTVMDTFTHTVSAYGRMAQRDYSIDLGSRPQGLCLGDSDGKGGQELINMEVPDLVAYRAKTEPRRFSGWQNNILPTLCADLDGDGMDEVIGVQAAMASAKLLDPHYAPPATKDDSRGELQRADEEIRAAARPAGGYLNLKTGVFTAFSFPAELDYRGNIFNGRIEELGIADVDGDGKLDVLARPYGGTLLFAFNQQGELVYYEEFGENVNDMLAGQSGGKRFVAVLTETRLLVWP